MAEQWPLESARVLEYEKDRDRLSMAIDAHMAHARERKWNRALQWFRNASFLAGQHLDNFKYRQGTFTQSTVVLPPRFQDIMSPHMVDNHILRITESNIADLTGVNPFPQVAPASMSPDDQDLAKIGEVAADQLWEDLRVPAKLRLALKYGAITGTYGFEVYFGQLDTVEQRMKLGKIKVPDLVSGEEVDDWGETGETEWAHKEGLRLRAWSGFHIDVNPDATSDPDTLTWVCRTTFEDIDLMRQLFDRSGDGFVKDALKGLGPQECVDDPLWHWEQLKDLVDSPASDLPVTLERGSRRALANCVRVRMIDTKPNLAFPMGRTVVQIGGRVAYDGPSRAWSEEYPEDWTPMEIGRWWTLPGRFEGYPLISPLIPLQKRINALHAIIRLNRQYMGIGVKLLPKVCGVPEGFIGPVPGQDIPYRVGPRGEKPEPWPFQPLTEDIWTEQQACVASMERIGGIAAAQLGANVSASALRSGTMLDFGQRQGIQSKSAILLDFDDFVGRVVGRILKQVSLHLADNAELLRRVAVAARELGDLAIERYTNLDLRDNVRVKVDIRSQMLQTPEAKKEAAALYLQFAGQNITAVERAKVATAMGLAEFTQEASTHWKRARRMVERVLQGDASAALVLEGVDDPAIFAEVVREAIQSERSLTAPPEVKEALQSLWDAYSEQMARRAQMQASVIAQTQQNSAPIASPAAGGQTGA